MAKNLAQMTVKELRCFLDSFDVVLSDCDGVLWIFDKLIPGALESLKTLQDLGKRIQLVSNNSTPYFKDYEAKVKPSGLQFQPAQLTLPSTVIAWYLNKINFRGEAFVIGSPSFRQTLTEAGIKMTPPGFPEITRDVLGTSVINAVTTGDSDAIVLDYSLRASWAQLTYAINRLKKEDLLYLSGTKSRSILAGLRKEVLGAGPLTDLVSRMSGKQPIECAKPSNVLREHLMDICQVKDPKRCLFIGDSIATDMTFATKCGFQKLFIETGMDNYVDTLKNEGTQPDYYLSTLGLLTSIIESASKNSAKMRSS
ncbi:uncharacterized protein LOC116432684 isoform X1 [Nomia melanderi]|uniref:uncharacterized protein LOC116432684 isoform X1 n=1 Tax=Nomia melanderi TaxID=2448451 RepID=UPI003FCCD22F